MHLRHGTLKCSIFPLFAGGCAHFALPSLPQKDTIREMAAEKRDLYFDSLKLVLIVFVAIGHTMEQLGGVLT